MARTRRRLLAEAALAAGGVALSGVATEPSAAARRRRAAHVVLVDWDAFGLDLLERARMPNLQALIARGGLYRAQGTYSTYSNSVRSSMSTGAYPEVHRNASFYLDRERGIVIGQTRRLEAETIVQALTRAGHTTASVGWYMVQGHGASYGDRRQLYLQPGVARAHAGSPAGGFATRVDAALRILRRRPVDSGGERVTVPRIPAFLAVYGTEIDDLRHREGAASPRLPGLLHAYDRELGRLVRGIRAAGLAGRTALVLTADHGFSSWTRSVMPALIDALVSSADLLVEVIEVGRAPTPGSEVLLTSNGVRMSNVYFRGRAAGGRGEAAVRAAAARVGRIPVVLGPADLRARRASPDLGDLVLEAEPPFHFSQLDDGRVRGSHGSTFELGVPLVLSGAGVRRRRGRATARTVDVAPTIAALLGAEPPRQAQGRVARGALA